MHKIRSLIMLPFLCLSLSTGCRSFSSTNHSPKSDGANQAKPKSNEFLNTNEDADLNLYQGTETFKPGVGVLSPVGCTAFEVKDRCVVTSAHCHGFAGRKYHQDLAHGRTSISAIRGKLLDAFAHEVQVSERDLQVIWLSDKNDDGTTAGFFPWNLALPPNVGSIVTIYGYGPDNVANGVNVGAGILRFGQMKILEFSKKVIDPASGQKPGEYFSLTPGSQTGSPPPTAVCPGDSGSPNVGSNGSVVGVTSRGEIDCIGRGPSYSTSMGGGNLEWIKDQMANFCIPVRDIQVSVTGAPGIVDLFNSTGSTRIFSCSNQPLSGQCSQKGLKGSLRLVATPGRGARFVIWAGGAACPCSRSNVATCTVAESFLNYNASDASNMELASCEAQFQANGNSVGQYEPNQKDSSQFDEFKGSVDNAMLEFGVDYESKMRAWVGFSSGKSTSQTFKFSKLVVGRAYRLIIYPSASSDDKTQYQATAVAPGAKITSGGTWTPATAGYFMTTSPWVINFTATQTTTQIKISNKATSGNAFVYIDYVAYQ